MTRTTAKYVALLALAIILFHWKTLLTNQFTTLVGYEAINQTYAWLHFWVNSLWHGRIPLWDPYVFGGRPYTEEMAAFYPLHLLFALAPLNRHGVISPRYYQEYAAFSRFLGAFFMFALLREMQRSHFAAFIGACAFSMGGMLARMPWLQYQESGIWLPAVLLFVIRALRSEGRLAALTEASLGGLCIGMSVLTGGVQFSMMQACVVITGVAYFGVASPSASGIRSHWLRLTAIAGITLAVSLLVGAVQLLPSFEYSHLSIRSISGGWFPMDQKIPWSRLVRGMWPQSLVTGIIPAGGPMGGEEAWASYVGAFPMFLVVTAIWKCRSNLWVRYFSILALMGFVYSLGEFSPLYGILYAVVPYLWIARGASRIVYLISFALAALSAFGLDSLLEAAGQREQWVPARPFLKWIALACVAALFVPALFTQLNLGIWTALTLLLILGSCVWYFRLTLRPLSPALRVMLAAFILFDLGAFNWTEADKNDLAKTGDLYEQTLTLQAAAAFVKAQPGPNRATVASNPEPNIGDIYGVQTVWGGGATVITSFSHLSTHQDLLNVRYRIKPASTPDPGAIYHDAFWKVYEDSNAFPRAWLTHQTVVEPSDDAVYQRLNTPGLNFHNVALVTAPLAQTLDPAGSGDNVRFRAYGDDGMSLDVNSSGTSLLVLSEVYYPGWKATVNGRPAEIRKVDGGLRGVLVPRGASRVELAYVPVNFYVGAALSLLVAGCVSVAWFCKWRGSRP